MTWPHIGSRDEPARGKGADLPSGVAEAVAAAVHDEFDQVLHYVVEALRRNNAFDELTDRLRSAERRLEARQERPLVVAVYQLLDHLRHLDFDPAVKEVLEAEIVAMLNAAGFEETGRAGEAYNPALHEAIDGRSNGGRATVSAVVTRGLSSFGDVVFRARVKISPSTVKADLAWTGSSVSTLAPPTPSSPTPIPTGRPRSSRARTAVASSRPWSTSPSRASRW